MEKEFELSQSVLFKSAKATITVHNKSISIMARNLLLNIIPTRKVEETIAIRNVTSVKVERKSKILTVLFGIFIAFPMIGSALNNILHIESFANVILAITELLLFALTVFVVRELAFTTRLLIRKNDGSSIEIPVISSAYKNLLDIKKAIEAQINE